MYVNTHTYVVYLHENAEWCRDQTPNANNFVTDLCVFMSQITQEWYSTGMILD